MRDPKSRFLEALLLGAAVLVTLLEGPAAALLLAGVAGLWIWRWASTRERWLAGSFFLVAVLLLGVEGTGGLGGDGVESRRREIAEQFEGLWRGLERASDEAAASLAPLLEESRAPGRKAFERLAALARRDEAERRTYLLFDAGGMARAWAGEGLLHEIEGEVPPAGRAFRLGFQSATLMTVHPLEAGGRAWSVVTGRSLLTHDLPKSEPRHPPLRWTLFRRGDVVPPDLVALDSGSGPVVAVEDWTTRAPDGGAVGLVGAGRKAAGATAAALLLIALMRLGAPGGEGAGGAARWSPAILGLAAAAASVALPLGVTTGTALALALLLAALSWRTEPRRRRLGPPWLWGLAIAAALLATALAVQGLGGPLERPTDLGSGLFGGGAVALAWRLTLAALAVALMRRVPVPAARELADGRSTRRAWLAAAALLLGGALHDYAVVGAVLLLLSGCLAGEWAGRRWQRRREGGAEAAVLCLLAALLAGLSWELVYRQNLKHHLKFVVLPELEAPSDAERRALSDELARHFRGLDLRRLVLPNPAGLDPKDLGIAVWRDSPLAVRGALSAVYVRPHGSAPAGFSFGLPLTAEGVVDWSPTRWRRVEEVSPADRIVDGVVELPHGERTWASVSYTMLLRPGWALSRRPIHDLAGGLLRGEGGPFRPDSELVEPAAYCLYEAEGGAIESPWAEAAPPADEVLAAEGRTVRTPEGPAFAFSTRAGDTVQALFLPRLGPVTALERIGTHVLPVVLVAALAGALGALLSVRRLALGELVATFWRSYSRRMLIVSALLLLVPILLLNLFALRVLGEELEREQRDAGVSALESAQRVLGEYILSLEPGFGVESVLDNELVSWLSRVVHHEINLYWGSSVYASSKSELFTAGLLPDRIPGEIYARLALAGAGLASRVNQAGDTAYLELYAPLAIPGVPVDRTRLFISVPLLAQQVETAEQVSSLQRRLLLATAALIVVLAAVGGRLARGFTAPLMEIVRGTQRIASGAASIEQTPADRELATLAEAIDRMARRIAEGRRSLLREKSMVDRMIDNVNSAVISLDRERRVLLRNRVARELLSAEVGESLDEVVARDERLAPVGDFLRGPADRRRLETVRLRTATGEEQEWSLVWVPLPAEGEPTALLVVEDVSEVLRAQRLQAWAEMARIIAHEIKNPLTPIRLSAEHMREVRTQRPAEFDRVFERCTRNILEQVEELQQISAEFSAYSRLPRIDPKPGDLVETVGRVVEAYRVAAPPGTRVVLETPAGELPARFDARLLGRALRNLIENAVRATSGGGEVRVVLGDDGGRATVKVLDDGPGVAPEQLPRIFDPYFSTHDSGTGLGLPIARRIAEEHGGGIQARNRERRGLEVEIWIPRGL